MSTGTVNIKVTKTQESRIKTIDFDNLPFGKHFSDHMLEMDYEDGAWKAPQIVPFKNIEIFDGKNKQNEKNKINQRHRVILS